MRIQVNELPQQMAGFENLAQFRAAQASDSYRHLAPLPKDAQELFDKVVVDVALERLQFVKALLARGLRYNLDNWLAVPSLYWEKISEQGHAIRTMTPGSKGERALPARSGRYLPIYATIDDFGVDIRTLLASRRSGAPLDTTFIAQATRRVEESVEDAALNGGITIDTNHVTYGLLNAPNANTFTYVDNEAWTASGHSGEDCLADLESAIQASFAANYFGPFIFAIPTNYSVKIETTDFKANSSLTIRQRLEEVRVANQNIEIVTVDRMPADRTALIQTTNNVVDIVVGDEPTPVTWSPEPGWQYLGAVMACMVPRFKSDYDSQSGITLGNKT